MTEPRPVSAIRHVLSIAKSMEQARTIKKLRAENDRMRAALQKFLDAWDECPAGIAPVGDPGMSVYLPDFEKFGNLMNKAQAAAEKALGR